MVPSIVERAGKRGERGATIALALLLFVVCAVVASIVLAAGTTASGRIAGLAEDDRIYYELTSAAKLIEKEIGGADADGHDVTIEVFNKTTEEHAADVPTSLDYSMQLDGENADGSSVIEQATSLLLTGNKTLGGANLTSRWVAGRSDSSAFWQSGNGSVDTMTLTYTVDGETTTVTIPVTMDSSGNLLFTLRDASNADSKLVVSFYPDIVEMTLDEELGAPAASGREVTEIQRCTVVWRPAGITWVGSPIA